MEVVERAHTLDAHRIRAIAVEACCDPRSVARFVRGVPLRSSLSERIETAMTDLERAGRLPSAHVRGAS